MSISEFIHILTVFSCFTIPHKSYFFFVRSARVVLWVTASSFLRKLGVLLTRFFFFFWSPYSGKKSENVTNINSINQRLLELGKGVLYLHRDKNSL